MFKRFVKNLPPGDAPISVPSEHPACTVDVITCLVVSWSENTVPKCDVSAYYLKLKIATSLEPKEF